MVIILRYMSHVFGFVFGFVMGIAMLKDPIIPIRTTVGHVEWWMPLFFITWGFISLLGVWHEWHQYND